MIRQILIERPIAGDLTTGDARRRRSVTVNLAESPLGWLHAHRRINDRQHAAGELLRRDYERAGLSAHVTMHWDAATLDGNRRDGNGAHLALAGQIDARNRFHAALDLAGPGLADILWRVICAGDSLALAEKHLDWPTRSAKLVLSIALDRVAAFYHVP